jgi:hypothetical protein
VTADGKAKYQCPGKAATDQPECCTQVPDTDIALQCVRISDEVVLENGTTAYTCDGGNTTTDTFRCCENVLPCANSGTCAQFPQFDYTTRKYTCTATGTVSDKPQCCSCTDTYIGAVIPGTEYASGQIFQPVFAVDAKTMKLISVNHGIVCGMKRPLVEAQFQGMPTVKVHVNIPITESAVDIFQLFDVLQRQGVFKPPK